MEGGLGVGWSKSFGNERRPAHSAPAVVSIDLVRAGRSDHPHGIDLQPRRARRARARRCGRASRTRRRCGFDGSRHLDLMADMRGEFAVVAIQLVAACRCARRAARCRAARAACRGTGFRTIRRRRVRKDELIGGAGRASRTAGARRPGRGRFGALHAAGHRDFVHRARARCLRRLARLSRNADRCCAGNRRERPGPYGLTHRDLLSLSGTTHPPKACNLNATTCRSRPCLLTDELYQNGPAVRAIITAEARDLEANLARNVEYAACSRQIHLSLS
jgi:hypothetical protein